MNPTQFTLPWQVIETDCGEHVYVTDAEGNQVVRLSKELVSIAHLIAAAPDLLAALHGFMAGAEAMGWSTDKAQAAIAKATGGAA